MKLFNLIYLLMLASVCILPAEPMLTAEALAKYSSYDRSIRIAEKKVDETAYLHMNALTFVESFYRLLSDARLWPGLRVELRHLAAKEIVIGSNCSGDPPSLALVHAMMYLAPKASTLLPYFKPLFVPMSMKQFKQLTDPSYQYLVFLYGWHESPDIYKDFDKMLLSHLMTIFEQHGAIFNEDAKFQIPERLVDTPQSLAHLPAHDPVLQLVKSDPFPMVGNLGRELPSWNLSSELFEFIDETMKSLELDTDWIHHRNTIAELSFLNGLRFFFSSAGSMAIDGHVVDRWKSDFSKNFYSPYHPIASAILQGRMNRSFYEIMSKDVFYAVYCMIWQSGNALFYSRFLNQFFKMNNISLSVEDATSEAPFTWFELEEMLKVTLGPMASDMTQMLLPLEKLKSCMSLLKPAQFWSIADPVRRFGLFLNPKTVASVHRNVYENMTMSDLNSLVAVFCNYKNDHMYVFGYEPLQVTCSWRTADDLRPMLQGLNMELKSHGIRLGVVGPSLASRISHVNVDGLQQSCENASNIGAQDFLQTFAEIFIQSE